jgi:hypothetical protein
MDSIVEAAKAIPAIDEALIGALTTEREGNLDAVEILWSHARFLTAIYRIAQDMGYEW